MRWDDDALESDDLDDVLELLHALGEDDDEDEQDEAAMLQQVERAFRSERARVRACEDLDELRGLRSAYLDLQATGGLNLAGRVRVRDLVELVDDRLTDLQAQRLVMQRARWPA